MTKRSDFSYFDEVPNNFVVSNYYSFISFGDIFIDGLSSMDQFTDIDEDEAIRCTQDAEHQQEEELFSDMDEEKAVTLTQRAEQQQAVVTVDRFAFNADVNYAQLGMKK